MYNVGAAFLLQDKSVKNFHADPKEENLGFVDIEGVRDYIKVGAKKRKR